MRKIMAEQRIVARDQNKVFVERAHRKAMSSTQAEDYWLIDLGKGNAYVEFDVEEVELDRQVNPLLGAIELFVVGNVHLLSRNPVGFENR